MKQDPQPERVRRLEALERGQHRVALHVVNARDAQPMRLGLRLPQRRVEQLGGGSGRCGSISSTARSSRSPVGSPAASRTMRPPNGSGVLG